MKGVPDEVPSFDEQQCLSKEHSLTSYSVGGRGCWFWQGSQPEKHVQAFEIICLRLSQKVPGAMCAKGLVGKSVPSAGKPPKGVGTA